MSYRGYLDELILDLDKKRCELKRELPFSSDYERAVLESRISYLDDEIFRIDRKLRYEAGE